MSVLVMITLNDLGVDYDQMLIEQTSGGDEMDFFADISGELALMELKDKEFNLGNAYSFGSKLGIVQPRHSIIVTSVHVGKDAKDHFEQAESAQREGRALWGPADDDATGVKYVEGIDRLQSAMEELVQGVYRRDAATVIRRVVQFAAPSADSVIEVLLKRAKAIPDVVAEPVPVDAQAQGSERS